MRPKHVDAAAYWPSEIARLHRALESLNDDAQPPISGLATEAVGRSAPTSREPSDSIEAKRCRGIVRRALRRIDDMARSLEAQRLGAERVALGWTCKSCGWKAAEDATFCGRCGERRGGAG